jgi:hypothetical protein
MDDAEFVALTTEEAFRKAVFAELRAMRKDFSEQFVAVNTRLSQQDIAIAQNIAIAQTVSDETKGVRDFMKDGANAAKFFCRVAKGWRFMWKSFVIPLLITGLVLYGLAFYVVHHTIPDWLLALAKAVA